MKKQCTFECETASLKERKNFRNIELIISDCAVSMTLRSCEKKKLKNKMTHSLVLHSLFYKKKFTKLSKKVNHPSYCSRNILHNNLQQFARIAYAQWAFLQTLILFILFINPKHHCDLDGMRREDPALKKKKIRSGGLKVPMANTSLHITYFNLAKLLKLRCNKTTSS